MMADVTDLPRQVFEIGWEQKSGIDECSHVWHSIPFRTSDDKVGFVEGCERCGSPRCGSGTCVQRRHHSSVHIYEDGSFEPLGGILAPEGGTR